MQLILSFFIGIQLSAQSWAMYFAVLNAAKKDSSTLDWSLYALAMAILGMRRVQVLLGVRLVDIGFAPSRSAVSVDTIFIQSALSLIFLYFAYRKHRKYQLIEEHG